MPRIENDYSFEAHEHSYELPHRVCEILEEIYAVQPNGSYVHPVRSVTQYLLRLCFVADAYKEKNPQGLTLDSPMTGEPEMSIDAIIHRQEIERAVSHDFADREIWEEYRAECLQKFDQHTFLELERLLGIDSRGVEAHDRNPFLGADINRIGAASTYSESIVTQKEARLRTRTMVDGVREGANTLEILEAKTAPSIQSIVAKLLQLFGKKS